jgi:hypothetical protein
LIHPYNQEKTGKGTINQTMPPNPTALKTNMVKAELQKIVANGESLTVEFKRCETDLSNSIFETVSQPKNKP